MKFLTLLFVVAQLNSVTAAVMQNNIEPKTSTGVDYTHKIEPFVGAQNSLVNKERRTVSCDQGNRWACAPLGRRRGGNRWACAPLGRRRGVNKSDETSINNTKTGRDNKKARRTISCAQGNKWACVPGRRREAKKSDGILIDINNNKTDKDSNKTDKDSNKTDKDSNKTDKDSNKTDKDSNKTDKDSNKTDKDSNKTDKDSNKTDKDSNKTDKDSNKTDKDSNKTDKDSNKTGEDNNKARRTIPCYQNKWACAPARHQESAGDAGVKRGDLELYL
eukprot:Pgem_evm1s13225